jgi:hypothetical protein
MELSRKFRVLDQTLSMHATLRDRYARRALVVDILLLACSVSFVATAFASDSALSHFGPSPDQIRFLLRIFSILAFLLSIVSLRIDWKGNSATHRDAAVKMSSAAASFRKLRRADGTWPEECASELDAIYSEAMLNSVPVPDAIFVNLKARHLRKVELSRMLDSNPGCPVALLRLALLCMSVKRVIVRSWPKGEAANGHEN